MINRLKCKTNRNRVHVNRKWTKNMGVFEVLENNRNILPKERNTRKTKESKCVKVSFSLICISIKEKLPMRMQLIPIMFNRDNLSESRIKIQVSQLADKKESEEFQKDIKKLMKGNKLFPAHFYNANKKALSNTILPMLL